MSAAPRVRRIESPECQAVAIMPATVRLRPDVVIIPLLGVDPSHVVLVARAGDRNALLTAFRRFAQSHLTDRAG